MNTKETNFDLEEDYIDFFPDQNQFFEQANLLKDNFTDFTNIKTLSIQRNENNHIEQDQVVNLNQIAFKESNLFLEKFDIPLIPISQLRKFFTP